MGVFPVSEAKEKALRERMEGLGIREDELDEKFIRSGGKGGQNVNKVATCVVLRHLPTATEVKCQQARTQGLNRYYARVLMADKVEAEVKGRESEQQKRIEKIRRQKRKRSKRAKEKMLEDKRVTSEKKRLRRRVKDDNG